MKDVARQLTSIVEMVAPRLSEIAENDSELKPGPNEWSKKEILGHLIDSATNNHQRFVRAVSGVADRFPTYDQIQWNTIQHYNEVPWKNLISFWAAYNRHLAHVITWIPREAESALCNIGEEAPARLDFVVKDYLRHLHHHMDDLINNR